MKLIRFIGPPVLLLSAGALLGVPPQSADVRLRAAQQKETVEGDLNAAIRMYRQIADDRSTPPEVAARALLRLGKCYQRMGSTEARKAFERVLAQFGGQETAVAEAKQLLTAMHVDGAEQPNDGVIVRKLQSGIRDYFTVQVTRDGRFMAVPRGRREVDVMNVITGERTPVRTQQPITASNEYIYGAAISPDGQRIVVDVPTGTNICELRMLDRITGQVRMLFRSESANRIMPWDWSRDGRTLLVNASVGDGLHFIDVVSGVSRRVERSGEPEHDARLSPDAQYIAYTTFPRIHNRGVGKISVQRADGSGDAVVADPEGGAMLAGWSPDGRYLLFTSNDLGVEHLWAIRMHDGRPQGQPVSLAKGIPQASAVATTATGSVLVQIIGSQRYYLAEINPGTGVANSPRNVNPRLNAEILAASWSPDGQQMVYTVLRDRSDKTPMDLYLRNEETNEDRKLGSFPLIGRKLSWAPDGNSLIIPYLSGEQSVSVFRYWLNDGKVEQLVPAKPGEPVAKAYPRISPDGRTVFYLEASYAVTGAKLIRYDVSSGQAQSIAVVGHNFDLSPDGEHLVIPAVDSVSKAAVVRIITKDGQPVRDLVRLKPEERILGVTWSPDGKWIYFGRGGDSGPEIHRVAVSGGASISTGLQTTGWPDIAVHPSGSRIAYLGRGGAELWRVDGLNEALTRLP